MSPEAAHALSAMTSVIAPIPRQSNLMDPTRCVMPVRSQQARGVGVPSTDHVQCGHPAGHGLLNLFCRQHAQILRRRWEESKCRTVKSTSQTSPGPISSSPTTASKPA